VIVGRTELPWLLWGRHVRPYAFAVSLMMGMLGWYILAVGNDAGTLFDGRTPPALIAGVAATTSCALLWAGFWLQSGSAMKTGLLLSAGVMFARAVLVAGASGWMAQSVWFSLAWVVASGGAYLLELTTAERANAAGLYRARVTEQVRLGRGRRE
jgi:hypothetical protein